ncbi:DUF6950 family protein [Cernens ardua]|uniref:DUF6950 family protein n=1 Tax=Cernens ardua TaxID=3402176 RepID=UPI003F944733
MRRPTWAADLHTYLSSHLDTPFQWGTFDCCIFAAGICMSICGVDPMKPYYGRYSTEYEAKRLILKEPGSLEAVWDACFTRINPLNAQRGDIVAFRGPQGLSMGVVWANSIFATSDSGITRINVTPVMAWRVE